MTTISELWNKCPRWLAYSVAPIVLVPFMLGVWLVAIIRMPCGILDALLDKPSEG